MEDKARWAHLRLFFARYAPMVVTTSRTLTDALMHEQLKPVKELKSLTMCHCACTPSAKMVHYHDLVLADWDTWEAKAKAAGFVGFVRAGVEQEF